MSRGIGAGSHDKPFVISVFSVGHGHFRIILNPCCNPVLFQFVWDTHPMNSTAQSCADLAKRLTDSGLRPTPQREVVFRVILEKRDHPTAEEIYACLLYTSPSPRD